MAPPTPREAVGFLAQMVLRLERYDDMVKVIDELAEKHKDLSMEEEQLMWTGYQSVLSMEEEQLMWTGYQSVFRQKHHSLQKIDAMEEQHTKYYHEKQAYIISAGNLWPVGFVEK